MFQYGSLIRVKRAYSNPNYGRRNPYVRRERFVDTWIYKGGNWVCVATDSRPVPR